MSVAARKVGQSVPVAAADTQAAFGRFLTSLPYQRPRELVLIQPALVPEQYFDVKTARACGYYNFPPVGLLYLAAAAAEIMPELDIRILDINHELLKAAGSERFSYGIWRERLRQILDECSAPLIGVTYMFGTTKPCFVDVCDFLRKSYAEWPVLAGGVQASYDYREILETGMARFVARKEGEGQLQALLKCLAAGEPSDLPLGSVIRERGEIIELGEPQDGQPIEWDLRPFYDLIDVEEYYAHGGLGAFSRFVGADKRYATVLSTRGCRARCTFCTVRNFNGFGVRQRTVESVIDEVKYLVEEKGIDYIDWLDDDLLWDRERTIALFKGLAEALPGLTWTASNGLIGVAVDEEVMDWMVRSGLIAFKIGIKSGNDHMLKLIKKPTTKRKLLARQKLFKNHRDVLFSGNFIIGFPQESFAQMLDTYNFALELETDWASFYICQPIKGTEIYSAFQSLGDTRCEEERYDKTINPGRSAERGEFGYRFARDAKSIATGWDVFALPRDEVPDLDQQKEIWFAFNLVANFLGNPNYRVGGNPAKIARWLRAIHDGYPYDASMAAALSHVHRLLGDEVEHGRYRESFLTLAREFEYWQMRCRQFPELLTLAGVVAAPGWFTERIPQTLVRTLPADARPIVSDAVAV